MKTGPSNKSFYIPEGMIMTGTFTTDGPGQIAGNVNGDVFVKGRLVILKNAVICGNVKAQEIEVWGKVVGFIQCTGKLLLQKSSFVKGNIRTVEIQVEHEAVIDGIIFEPVQHNTKEKFAPAAAQQSTPEIVEEPVTPVEKMSLIKGEKVNDQSWF